MISVLFKRNQDQIFQLSKLCLPSGGQWELDLGQTTGAQGWMGGRKRQIYALCFVSMGVCAFLKGRQVPASSTGPTCHHMSQTMQTR